MIFFGRSPFNDLISSVSEMTVKISSGFGVKLVTVSPADVLRFSFVSDSENSAKSPPVQHKPAFWHQNFPNDIQWSVDHLPLKIEVRTRLSDMSSLCSVSWSVQQGKPVPAALVAALFQGLKSAVAPPKDDEDELDEEQGKTAFNQGKFSGDGASSSSDPRNSFEVPVVSYPGNLFAKDFPELSSSEKPEHESSLGTDVSGSISSLAPGRRLFHFGAGKSTAEEQNLWRRVEWLMLWFIDATSATCASDSNWEYFVMRRENNTKESADAAGPASINGQGDILGVCSVYAFPRFASLSDSAEGDSESGGRSAEASASFSGGIGKRFRISQFMVSPTFWGQGVGTGLLSAIESYTRTRGGDILTAESPNEGFCAMRDLYNFKRAMKLVSRGNASTGNACITGSDQSGESLPTSSYSGVSMSWDLLCSKSVKRRKSVFANGPVVDLPRVEELQRELKVSASAARQILAWLTIAVVIGPRDNSESVLTDIVRASFASNPTEDDEGQDGSSSFAHPSWAASQFGVDTTYLSHWRKKSIDRIVSMVSTDELPSDIRAGDADFSSVSLTGSGSRSQLLRSYVLSLFRTKVGHVAKAIASLRDSEISARE